MIAKLDIHFVIPKKKSARQGYPHGYIRVFNQEQVYLILEQHVWYIFGEELYPQQVCNDVGFYMYFDHI